MNQTLARRNVPSYSTSTLQGLLQIYAASERYVPRYNRPERLRAALDNPLTHDLTIERLQMGAGLLTCLDLLNDGRPEALLYMGSVLRSLALQAFRGAERGGDVA